MRLHQRIAEYAYKSTNPGSSGLSVPKLVNVIQLDVMLKDIIGSPENLDSLTITDLFQACLGAYIYGKILTNNESYESLSKKKLGIPVGAVVVQQL